MGQSVRVAILSRRRAAQRVWHASQYEFEDVIAEIDDASLVSPLPRRVNELGTMVHNASNRVGYRVGRARRALMVPSDEVVDAEVFFAVFAAPSEINALPHATAQLKRSRRKVAFLIEMYETQIESSRDYLRQLRGFDHIFVFTRSVIPAVERITGVPTSFLATGVDAELFAPRLPAPERHIDVMSYGRRLPRTHEVLTAAARDDSLHYFYDTVAGRFDVSDHRDHRLALAAALQRSRFALVYKNNDDPGRRARTAGEETLSNRYFEATSAGAVVLGTAPDVADFADNFDWPDAVVPIGAPAPDILRTIEELGSDPGRLAAARRAGILAALRRHDWAFRWRSVLESLELPESPALAERIARLEQRAVLHEAPASAQPPGHRELRPS